MRLFTEGLVGQQFQNIRNAILRKVLQCDISYNTQHNIQPKL